MTIDVVVFRVVGARIEVLTVERLHNPFAGRRALPGVWVGAGETLLDACHRCLAEKAGLGHIHRRDASSPTSATVARPLTEPRQFLAADSVARDPRGHAVSIVHMAAARADVSLVSGESPAWLDVGVLVAGGSAGLAFDHLEVVVAARRFLADRLWADAACFTVLAGDAPLTTPTLRTIAESAGGVELDHANFSRRLASSGLFVSRQAEVSTVRSRGRPAIVWEPAR